jgi:hypothetical protein
LDAGVLLAGWRGSPDAARRYHALVNDPGRSFVFSDYLLLEVLPKAVYFGHTPERHFYEHYFNHAARQQPSTTDAYATASRYGLAAIDALHLQAALDAGAAEFVTTERPTKPLHRARGIRITDFSAL